MNAAAAHPSPAPAMHAPQDLPAPLARAARGPRPPTESPARWTIPLGKCEAARDRARVSVQGEALQETAPPCSYRCQTETPGEGPRVVLGPMPLPPAPDYSQWHCSAERMGAQAYRRAEHRSGACAEISHRLY